MHSSLLQRKLWGWRMVRRAKGQALWFLDGPAERMGLGE